MAMILVYAVQVSEVWEKYARGASGKDIPALIK